MSNSQDNYLDPEEFYRTDDMTAVTFLRYHGHQVQATKWNGDSCVWIFRVSDNLLDRVEEFVDGRGLVEPRAYGRAFSQTKKELYSHKS